MFLEQVDAHPGFEEGRLEGPVVGQWHQALLEGQVQPLEPLHEQVTHLILGGGVQQQFLHRDGVLAHGLLFSPFGEVRPDLSVERLEVGCRFEVRSQGHAGDLDDFVEARLRPVVSKSTETMRFPFRCSRPG